MNPFMAAAIALNLGAAGWAQWHSHDWKMAGVYVCYAVASLLLGLKA